ncbi:MAG: SpoIIE family protein phosphatase, partial [Flavobacteriales bacterium]
YGNGVFRQQGKKFVGVTTKNGLPSDYCYFIQAGNDNDVWVGHRGSLSRINSTNQRIVVFENGDGVDCDFNEIASYKEENGQLWFGSNKGTIKFDPRKYVVNGIQPVVNIKNILFSDKEMDFNRPVELSYNNYRVVINFIGINFTNPEKVKYKYKLKGFDLAWSDVTDIGQAYYPKISDGEYEFVVKASNEDGVFGSTTASIKIIVASPFWKRWWFFVICFAFLVALVVVLIKLRERNQKKIRLYLERQLQLRTKELVEQKHLVEEKNKDITDSINYAHKIQSGILPSIREIKNHIPDCFVMYKPRDIVSGDFYWYSVKKNIFSIAVADCTGHGVPGAFMSMIGSTIFKEVSKEITQANPALFIEHVDQRVAALMNPDRKTQFQDGMDMVLIELDLKTGHVVFSGAGRPLLQIKPDGSHILHKTCSDSIGGHNLAKSFTNSHIKLEKGDAIYMYSDGIVDQFGGDQGKKIMTSGFINWLTETKAMSMPQQGEFLNEAFENWRGGEFQIDDVLVVGIRHK